jgi:DNA helicase-2/ATP-dependent DNA helicase PcrA
MPDQIPVESTVDPLLEGLNAGQRQAVTATGGPVLILAGAGSGKTRAITHRIAWHIEREGIRPWNILAVTFTNKAAQEMRSRVVSLLGDATAADVHMGTFHATCLRILRQYAPLAGLKSGFVIYDTTDQKALLSRILKERKISDKAIHPRRIASFIDQQKNEGRTPEHPDVPRDDHFDRLAAEIYAEYDKRLLQSNAVDFGGLLLKVHRIFQERPDVLDEYRHRWTAILVDEFQDTNYVQYRFLKDLDGGRGAICVVGDDDQSIYGWRGARVENILRFPENFPNTQVVVLDQNYRSSANILKAASAVIALNPERHEKTLWTEREEGDRITLHVATNERTEAAWISRQIERQRRKHPLREMAIFYRTNSLSRVLEDALRTNRIPYRVYGGLKFYDRAEVKDLLAYLKLLVNPADQVSLMRIINTPTRGIGTTSIDQILVHAATQDITPFEALHELAEGGTKAMQKKLRPFVEMIAELHAIASTEDAATTAQRVLERSGYWMMLQSQGTVEAEARLDNLHEFIASVEEFLDMRARSEGHALADFLDQVALVSDTDDLDADEETLSLMTVHAAKGLEFDVVFLAGVEDGVLPHHNAGGSEAELAEERRLTYVAMTRARHHLALTRARMRRRHGGLVENPPSRFLQDIPRECLLTDDPMAARLESVRRQGFTGRPGASFNDPTPEPTFVPDEGDSFVDPSYAQDIEGATPGPGTPVRHAKFGRGIIHSISGDGPSARVTVNFPIGVKTIVARFLVLDMS